MESRIRYQQVFKDLLSSGMQGLTQEERTAIAKDEPAITEMRRIGERAAAECYSQYRDGKTVLTQEALEAIYEGFREAINDRIYALTDQFCSKAAPNKKEAMQVELDALTKFRSLIFEVMRWKYGVLNGIKTSTN